MSDRIRRFGKLTGAAPDVYGSHRFAFSLQLYFIVMFLFMTAAYGDL